MRITSLLQAKADCRRGPALCTMQCTPARTEHGDKRLAAVAIDSPINLHRSNIHRAGLALIALVAFRSLRTLRPWHALDALCSLWPRRSLWPGVALRSWLAATCSQG